MPLRLVCGPAGSGKTTRSIEAFLTALDAGKNPVFIAPSIPDAMHFERRILRERPVLTGGKVTTFDGISREILAVKEPGVRILKQSERLTLIRSIIDARGSLRVLKDSSGFDGFVSALSELFSEIELAGAEPGDMQEIFFHWSKGNRWREDLIRDLFSLYQEYREALKQARTLDEEIAQRLALSHLQEGGAPRFYDQIVIDGFWDFTQLQHEMIHKFESNTDVLVTLPYLSQRASYAAPAFHLEKFIAAGAEAEYLPAAAPGGRSAGLSHLVENLFEEDRVQFKTDGDIILLQAAGLRGQADLIAAEILRLQRSGQSLDEVTVICRSIDRDLLAVAAALESCGVPYELPAPLPLGKTPVGTAARAALDFAAGVESRANLFRFLRSGLPDVPDDVVDRFDRYTRRHGIEERDDLLFDWKRFGGGRAFEGLNRLAAAVRAGAEDTGTELCHLIGDLVSVRAGSAVTPAGELSLDMLSLSSLQSVCNEAAEATDIISALQSKDIYYKKSGKTNGDATGILRRGINTASIRLRAGQRRGCVRLLDPHRVLNQRFDIVFLCGLLEKQFPSMGREDAFFPDADRRELAARLPLKTRDRRLEEERFLFHRTISRARHRLYLCYPYCDKEGKPTIRSLFLEDALDLFDKDDIEAHQITRKISDVTFPAGQAPTKNEALKSLALAASVSHRAGKSYDSILAAAEQAAIDDRLRNCVHASEPKEAILSDPEILKQLQAREEFSVTGLQRYLRCPFRFFVESLLDPADMDAVAHGLHRGRVVHKILCQFGEILRRLKLALPDTDENQLQAARRQMAGLIEEEFAEAGSDLETVILKNELSYHLSRYIDREKDSGRHFQVYDVEVSFGNEGDGKKCGGKESSRDMLNIAGVRLHGRIDRIDWAGDRDLAMIIDYKSSKYVESQSQFEKKKEIQIPLYLQALKIFGLKPIAGEYYSIRGDQRAGLYLKDFADILGAGSGQIKKADFVDEEVFEEKLGAAQNFALEAVEGIRNGRFPSEPLNEKSDCRSCDLKGLCRHAETKEFSPETEDE